MYFIQKYETSHAIFESDIQSTAGECGRLGELYPLS